jgi:Reverse transcriptase (RNA-dependent DNA polymerase)
LDLLEEFETFVDHGMYTNKKASELIHKGYQYIKLIMVYDVKHNGRYQARLVAAGYMTRPGSNTYSSVVSLRMLRLALLIGELNGLKMMVGEVTSAYLMALTKELIFFKAGDEFGKRAGHLMVVRKSLYGLRTSGKSWHDLLFDTLKDMGFTPSLANPDIWMQDAGDCYEYVCLYVDDLTVIMHDPKTFFDNLSERGFLGGSVGRDPDGTLWWGAKQYIARCNDTYERIMGEKATPRGFSMPEKSQPELEESSELDDKGQSKYQSLISCLQW